MTELASVVQIEIDKNLEKVKNTAHYLLEVNKDSLQEAFKEIPRSAWDLGVSIATAQQLQKELGPKAHQIKILELLTFVTTQQKIQLSQKYTTS